MTNLQTRVKGILTNPRAEWSAIAAEPDDVAAIYRNYIVFLAAIPAICMFLGLTIFGVPLFGRYGYFDGSGIGRHDVRLVARRAVASRPWCWKSWRRDFNRVAARRGR